MSSLGRNGLNFDELGRDEYGWPIWPPQDPAIWASITRLWESGQWGKYQSAIREELIDAVRVYSATEIETAELPESWRAFDARFAQPLSIRLTSSGTVAIELALRGSGVTIGSEVVLAAYDFPGNFRTVELIGAKPVLVDVLENGTTMDPDSLRQVEGESIRAVIVSHLHGQLADVLAIRQVCDERGWALIEDACQSPGAGWIVGDQRSRQTTRVESDSTELDSLKSESFLPVGILADATTLSFGGSKPLSAGNGGALLMRSDRMIAKVDAYCDRPSDTFPLSPLQAAALIPQWNSLTEFNTRRATMADKLHRWDWSALAATCFTAPPIDQRPAYYKFPIMAASRESRITLIERLKLTHFPVGEGFRSMHATSDRRSRKPVPLPHARELSERAVLIDHRALLDGRLIQKLNASGL